MSHVLVIAKDAVIRNTLATRLSHELVTEAVTAPDEAKRRLHVQYFDLVIYDAEQSLCQRNGQKLSSSWRSWLTNGPILESLSYRTAKNSTLPAPV